MICFLCGFGIIPERNTLPNSFPALILRSYIHQQEKGHAYPDDNFHPLGVCNKAGSAHDPTAGVQQILTIKLAPNLRIQLNIIVIIIVTQYTSSKMFSRNPMFLRTSPTQPTL